MRGPAAEVHRRTPTTIGALDQKDPAVRYADFEHQYREGFEDQEAITARNDHSQQHADEMIDETTRKFWEDDRKLEQIYKELECLRALP